ncbi:MAG: hypothetical protein GY696_05365 [Gammaproteobacteria bacterium]|nr:hypothetical protein [Gammaproteobacteria bacterium]
MPDQRIQNQGRKISRRKNRKRNIARRICSVPPTLVNPCTSRKAPTPPLRGEGTCPPLPLPPEGVDTYKGGGKGAQKDLKPNQAKTKGEGEMCKEEGGQPVQDDPKPQSSDNQQNKIKL